MINEKHIHTYALKPLKTLAAQVTLESMPSICQWGWPNIYPLRGSCSRNKDNLLGLYLRIYNPIRGEEKRAEIGDYIIQVAEDEYAVISKKAFEEKYDLVWQEEN